MRTPHLKCGLTNQEIADTVGVSRAQVQDDLNGNNKKSSSGHFAEPDEEILDAEIVEEDEPVNYDRLARARARVGMTGV